jgi:hypothetical protein
MLGNKISLKISHIFKLPLPVIVTLFNVFLTCVNIPLFQVYKSFSDAVLLDWFISLTDKDRMSHCDVTYFKLKGDSDDVTPAKENSDDVIPAKENSDDVITAKENSDDVIAAKENSDDVMVVSSFMPTSRTFVLKPLEANQGPML